MSVVAHQAPPLWAAQHCSGAEMAGGRRTDRIGAMAAAMAAPPGGRIPTRFAHPYARKAASKLFQPPEATPENVPSGPPGAGPQRDAAPRGLTCSSKRRPHWPSPAEHPCPDSGLWGMERRASKAFWCPRCWGPGGRRLQPPPQAAAAPPWQSSGCAPSSMRCGSLVPQAHHEPPPRRDRTGSGHRRHGSPPASGLAPPLKGYAGAGAVIVRRTSMHLCAVATLSAMGASCVRPQSGPSAIHRPARVPDASWRWYAGLAPSTQVAWRGGRGRLTQRGEPPSSSAPQRSRAVPRGALARAWAVNRASRVQPGASGNHSLTRPKGWHG